MLLVDAEQSFLVLQTRDTNSDSQRLLLLRDDNVDDVLQLEPRLRDIDVTSASAEGAMEEIITRLWNFNDVIPDDVVQRCVSTQ